jgi:DNA-binding transcriptional LysR family regulator
VARKIFASYGGLLASPAYLAARGTPGSLQELLEHDCVTQPPDSGNLSTWRLQGPDGVEEDVRVRGRFISNVQGVLLKAACAGLGIAALPSILTASDVAAGRLVPVLPQYMRAGRGLSVIYASRQYVPQAVSTFVDMAMEKLSQQDWAPAARLAA